MEMPAGHLVIHDTDQALLLNTGCPVSMGTRPSIRFLDREIPVLQRYHGMTVAQWGEVIGVRLDGLLGSDVLGRHAVAIDPEAATVVFDGDGAPEGRSLRLETVAGMPVVEVGIAGRKLRLLFHTGATLSCLRDADTRSLPCVGVVRDCYPGMGEFTTELRRVPLLFGDQPVNLECGLMPAELDRVLRPVDVHGVVGTNLLDSFAVSWGSRFSQLSLVARHIVIVPAHPAPSESPHPTAYPSVRRGEARLSSSY